MLRKSVLGLAFLFVSAMFQPAFADAPDPPAHHVTGYPLLKGLPKDSTAAAKLAALIEASLKKDPSGHAVLDPVHCKPTEGSCATPHTYLDALAKWHPESGFSTSDADLARLPGYIKSLHYARAPKSRFLSSRMIRVNGKWQLDLSSGFSRELEPDEYAWYDTQTGEVIFLDNCGNIAKMLPAEVAPVAVEVPPCVQVEWNSDEGDEVRVAVIGAHPVPASACTKLQEAGEATTRVRLPNDCPGEEHITIDGRPYIRRCDFSRNVGEVSEIFGTQVSVQLITSYVSKVGGKNVLYLPRIVAEQGRQYEVVVCRVRRDGAKYMDEGVRSVHFRNSVAVIGDQYWQLAEQ